MFVDSVVFLIPLWICVYASDVFAYIHTSFMGANLLFFVRKTIGVM